MSIFKKKEVKEKKVCVVYVTTYPPRECGIATFSADLISYSDELFLGEIETKVVAINTTSIPKRNYSSKVLFEIVDNDKTDYILAAEKLNAMDEVKIVSIQHEFGIFGDNYGENLILFLEKLKKPVAITFHTVLPYPVDEMKLIMEKIIDNADRFVVMTELSKRLLITIYGAPEEKIKIIPHGIHPQLYEDTTNAKKILQLENKLVLTTFGLLSRGKGIEYAIEALPRIIEKYPNTIYLILGATHPIVLKNEGEIYRNELIAQAVRLGVQEHVVFHNEYLSIKNLLTFLQATDIYLSLSQNPDQAVSGTLTYGLGAGRAVISTPFMQAKEIINKEVGVLIDFNDHKSISEEVLKLFDDKEQLLNMGRSAYFCTRNMTWPNVALSYMSMFSSLFPSISEKNKYMLPIKIDHLKKLTDDFGVLQFASLHNPDPKWGYTLDDNARALVVLCWYNTLQSSTEIESMLDILFDFIERASKDTGGFINYFTLDKNAHYELNENQNLEETNARALWALAVLEKSIAPSLLKLRARTLFEKQFLLHQNATSPRAAALCIKAFAEYISSDKNNPNILNQIKWYADFLVDLFQRTSDDKWQWFEETLTYSNALLPEALLVAYTISKNPLYFEIAKASLDFLLEQSFEGDICVPVGQAGWFKKGNLKERFDQQPEEVSALVLALHRMFLISGDSFYHRKMVLAFDWFLGNNLSHQVVYTHLTGGCYDGIIKGGTNLNQGAESTISYLLARLVLESKKID